MVSFVVAVVVVDVVVVLLVRPMIKTNYRYVLDVPYEPIELWNDSLQLQDCGGLRLGS